MTAPAAADPTASCTVLTAELGGSPLSRAMQERTVPAAWLALGPGDRAAWRTHLEAVRAEARARPGGWLSAIREAFGPLEVVGTRQRLLDAADRGVVVTTGQQPGLFGGPAYTITKALSALALADELSGTFGVPVAPVFWAATDDADWREASAVHVVGRDGLQALQMPGAPTEGVAMADVPLGDVSRERAALRASAASVVAPSVLELVDRCYAAPATVGSAYVAWLRGLLEPLGVAVLDASHAALRTALDAPLRRALSGAATVDAALQERTAEIIAAGFAPQVERVDGLSLVFTTRDGVRARVPLADAASVAAQAPEGSLGANVLLRPVVERALLPTVAYVAGPGELAYFAQVTAVAEALALVPPVAVPRWAASWREAQVERIVERLGVGGEDVREPHRVEARLARSAMDRGVADALEQLRRTLDVQVDALGHALVEDGRLVPEAVVAGLQRDLSHRLDRVERRLVAAVKRRQLDVARDLAVLRAAHWPLGRPAERVLSLVPTLARHGLGVLTQMRHLTGVHARALVSGGRAAAE
jgi:uncharacterized protein YllA (UPF0747 family)